MNIENIDKAIAIMERAKASNGVSMRRWQETKGIHVLPVKTEEELHACGNKACLAGWIAVSPEWKAFGGESLDGEPVLHGEPYANGALGKWWEVSSALTGGLIYPDPCLNYVYDTEDAHPIYGKPWGDIKADDVIRILQELREIGEQAFFEKYIKNDPSN